jgi:hypothetical protein
MTNTKRTLTEVEARRYFRRMLEMNPLYDPSGVLALRRKSLGLTAAVREEAFSAAATGQQRAAVLEELDRLRREFWTLPLDQLQKSLESINVKRLPDLRPLVNRLRMVAACRGEFPRLASSMTGCLPLVHAFKSAVVLPPAEAGMHKEQFIRSVKDKRQVKQVKQAAQKIKSEFPLLYDLEKDWFETLMKLKARYATESAFSNAGGSIEWESLGPGVVFAIIILLRFLLMALR